VVRTATEWAARAEPLTGGEADEGDVDLVRLDVPPTRPGGARFGTLVHAALATVPLDAGPEIVARVVTTQARLVAATTEEVAAADEVVRTVLRHPLLEEARAAAGGCLREVPVMLAVGDTLVEGIADFAFEHGGRLTVLDFKTDRAEGETLARYRRQLALYAAAVARATGKPARAVLMQI
jgi:ATP-dependent exoDNAse (exonuclease V) beta subunit